MSIFKNHKLSFPQPPTQNKNDPKIIIPNTRKNINSNKLFQMLKKKAPESPKRMMIIPPSNSLFQAIRTASRKQIQGNELGLFLMISFIVNGSAPEIRANKNIMIPQINNT